MSRNCIPSYHHKTFQFSDFTVIRKKNNTYCVTEQSGRGYCSAYARIIYFPEWRENPIYIGNQEMSDKSRNRLRKKEVLPCLFRICLPVGSSFFILFLAIPAALVAIPVSFITIEGVFHAVGKPAHSLPQCSVTKCQFRVWVAALCRRQAHAHQNASLVVCQGYRCRWGVKRQ